VEILKLPGLRKEGNQTYAARRLQISTEEIRSLRSDLLLTAVKSFRPDVVLVDKHPFGASGEFKAGLKALRRLGGKAVLGLRDILDEPASVLREWRPYRMRQRILEYYHCVLVYGERRVFNPISAYEFPAALADRTRFCGYVYGQESERALENFEWPFPPREQRSRPVVLATTGGGEDGFRLLRNFMLTAGLASWQGVAVAGPMTPEPELKELRDLAERNGVVMRSFVPHLSALFGSIDALVCMGGYNTLVEAVATGVPTVCVPRVAPRTEQLIRARAFESLGLIQVCLPEQLETGELLGKIETALQSSPATLRAAACEALKFDGGRRAAECLISLGEAGSLCEAATASS
jgi:predicted glycosyltransferase